MNLLELDFAELEKYICGLGEPKFRAKQIYSWLCSGAGFAGMLNIPASLREKLAVSASEGYLSPLKELTAKDGTKKYLFMLNDGNTVESVVMHKRYGKTLCLSTQVGCRMGCVFCASCKNGRIRDLSPGEMLAQYIAANKDMGGGRSITNIVLMGMGEPFDNYDNVVSFLRRINDKNGIGVSYRDISLSTCGLVPEMIKFADENIPVTLCVSLHAATDEKRRQLIPAAKKWGVRDVISAAKTYFEKTHRRIIIEYAVTEGFNDTKEDTDAIKKLLHGMNCHINLIPLNKNEGCTLKVPSKSRVYAFAEELKRRGLSVTVRLSLGSEIAGACGQLRNTAAEMV